MGRCKFRDDWLLKNDSKGQEISSWGKKYSDHELYCNICACIINVQNKGFHSILQHSDSARHIKLCRDVLNPKQLHLAVLPQNSMESRPSTSANLAPIPLSLFCVTDTTTTAELIWTMKSVCSNFSAASCKNIAETFATMFPGDVSKHFSLSPKKMHYLITDALQPYFQKLMRKDINNSSYYTICFDETTNVEDKKELQITIRYWSDSRNEIVNKHLHTYFIGKADANILLRKIISAIEDNNLPLQNMLMLGSDGPKVNKKVFRLFNEEILSVRSKGLIDIGTCPIHIIHNAFLKGMQALGHDAVALVISIYNYFDGWPSRIEEYEKIQEELNLPVHRFIKHSSTRWLTFGTAALRVIEQWEGINSYFFKLIPSTKPPKEMQTPSYKKISSLLKTPLMKAELYFAVSSANVFTSFTKKFQQDEPLIHVIYVKLQKLIQTLAGRICKADVSKRIEKCTISEKTIDLLGETNLLPLDSIILTTEVQNEMSDVNSTNKTLFLKSVQMHYSTACKYIIETANFSRLVKALRCLQPAERTKPRSCKDIVTIARSLPIEIPEDTLIDEWKLLQLEDEPQPQIPPLRIEAYWTEFLTKKDALGTLKFNEVAKVVKCAFTLSHGNAEVERRFSVSKWALTEDKTAMSERTLNAILTTKDALREYNNLPHLVPITKEFINLARSAHKNYQLYLEEVKINSEKERKVKENEEQIKKNLLENKKKFEDAKKKIEEIEFDLEQKAKDYVSTKETATNLFQEATKRLTAALKNNDLKEAKMAHAMLEGVNKVQELERKKSQEVQSLQKNIEKRKSNIISTFLCKKAKFD